ncbi:MAG: SRPBCC family protein [Leptospiraceae bacterium]|nr:SRPBCC family protein [Leptospiraceae bacterium]
MIKKISLTIVGLIAGFLIYVATKPNSFKVERSIVINADSTKILAQLNDFQEWYKWSPWDKLDPNLKRKYSGEKVGKGTIYEWEGNSDVGKGRMEIIESTPTEVKIKLDFIEPMEANNLTVFTLVPENNGTKLVWTMTGPSPFSSKLFDTFMNFDKMIGKDFENGLQNLKATAEK